MSMIPVGVVISRASAESAWKRARNDGREITAGDLDLTWETADTETLSKAARGRVAGFVSALRKPTEEDHHHDEKTVAGAC